MKSRRHFMKQISLLAGGAVIAPLLATSIPTKAWAGSDDLDWQLDALPDNIIHSANQQGVWKGKGGSHIPEIKVSKEGDKYAIKLETLHPMKEDHYIVRHTVVTGLGEQISAKTFSWKDDPVTELTFDPRSVTQDSQHNRHKDLYVLSFCNKHDLWMAKHVLA